MMRQYWELKARYQNCLLFFRLGDFYEMFFEDAERASQLLGLTLTARESGTTTKAPMCGVPYHSAQSYIAKLLKLGEKVALCEQMEDPRQVRGLVKRDVVRVLTPGTLVESDLLAERVNNYLSAVAGTPAEFGLASVDLSTGEFMATAYAGRTALEDVRDELLRLQPAECLATRDVITSLQLASHNSTAVDDVPSPIDAKASLQRHFQIASLTAFGCEDRPVIQQAAALLLEYLQRTHKGGLAHLKKLTIYSANSFLRLDPFTLDALEIVEARSGAGQTPTLLSTLDLTTCAMGGRQLRQWLLRPLVLAGEILNRLDAVEWLVEHPGDRANVRDSLKACADLERIAARVGSQSANARDLAAMRATLGQFSRLKAVLVQAGAPGLLAEHTTALDDCPDLQSLLATALVEDPPQLLTEGGLIRDGYHSEVDELRLLTKRSKDFLLEIQTRERRRTGIANLKVQYNSVFGYFIEVSKGKTHLVPANYQRKQTLTGAERYITPELKEIEGKILGAQEKLCSLEHELFLRVRAQVAESVATLLHSAHAAGAVDALAALAEAASRYGYVRPAIDAGGTIEIIEGRHPVLERVQSTFVSNDVRLLPWQEQILIVTGPNMAGKSTYLRQTALITLMAHVGSFVPAKEARIAVVDGIYCRIGASDRLAQGLSTFMVEMTEVAQILNHATDRSLLIFDEVGRGTSTYDGISIAWAIVEHIAKDLGAKTLFATHYYELTALADEYPSVKNYNVLVREWKNELVFLYKINPGRADRSYGVQVAKLAGLPEPVISRSRDLLKEFERTAPRENSGRYGGQLSLFQPLPDPVRYRLEAAEVEALTPLEAMNLLHELRELLRGAPTGEGGFSNA